MSCLSFLSPLNLILIENEKKKKINFETIFCLDVVEPMLHQSQYMYISRVSHQATKISFATK